MFIPNTFKMKDLADKHRFIQEFGFAVMVSTTESLAASHLPFMLRTNEGEQGVLYAHCAKANPVWKDLAGQKVLVIFTGPHSYISPSWYSNTPAVPTWNYTAVHAFGVASLLNAAETLKAIDDLVKHYEPALLVKKDIVTDSLKHKMLAGIVGFKIEITKLEGQLKLGQNKSKEDQLGVYNALKSSSNYADLALAQYMQSHDENNLF